MTKKQTKDAWLYGAVGFGVAALVAMPFIPAIMAYYRQPAAQKEQTKQALALISQAS